MRPGRLSVYHLPKATESLHWKPVLYRYPEGMETGGWLTMKPHGGLRVGVPWATFAGLVRFDPTLSEDLYELCNPSVQPRNTGNLPPL